MNHSPVTMALYVQPGASSAQVGGSHDGVLRVKVRARAVEGAATSEVLSRVAEAFGVRGGAVELVRGATSRHKTVRVTGDPIALRTRYQELLAMTTSARDALSE